MLWPALKSGIAPSSGTRLKRMTSSHSVSLFRTLKFFQPVQTGFLFDRLRLRFTAAPMQTEHDDLSSIYPVVGNSFDGALFGPAHLSD